MTPAEGPHGDEAQRVVRAIGRWQAARPGVLVVAIDGHGGAGKSTLAAAVARATGAALVHTDDFFQPPAALADGPAPEHIPSAQAAGPPGGPARARRSMAQYYDWPRMRAQAVQPLRAGRRAMFRRFGWEPGTGFDGTRFDGTRFDGTRFDGTRFDGTGPDGTALDGNGLDGTGLDSTVTVAPAALIVLEGVFSTAPELSDLIDRSVLVDTPEQERLKRLRARITPEEWDSDWLLAEHAYFGAIRPPSSFDLVVSGAGINPPVSGR